MGLVWMGSEGFSFSFFSLSSFFSRFSSIFFSLCETPGQLQGFKTPSPETPRKKLKNYRAPTPNSLKNAQKILKIPGKQYFSGIFCIF